MKILRLISKSVALDEQNLTYLGHIVGRDGVKPYPNKTKVIQECKPPKPRKELETFLGIVGYYQRFIKDYSSIVFKLNKLKNKNIKFEWEK